MRDECEARRDEGDDAGAARVVADYIAGMTDRFALQAHESIAHGRTGRRPASFRAGTPGSGVALDCPCRCRLFSSRSRSSRRRILPTLVFGSSSTNSTARGTL
jgi:hypothetical protein